MATKKTTCQYGDPACEQLVWNKGKVVKGKDPDKIRKDIYDNIIWRDDFNKDSPHGWEIKQILKSGSNLVDNLQPLKFSDNR